MKNIIRSFWVLLAVMIVFAISACAETDENTLTDGAIYSDIIAGLDMDSVYQDASATFFSSVMSDGTLARFQGENIAIDEAGITLWPDSRVTSLDALGRIYLYRAEILNGEEAPIDEQWLDVGYGYTFSTGKMSVETANDVFAEIMGGYPAFLWNQGVELSLTDYAPNFLFVRGASGNTCGIKLTSLTIAYDPGEKLTRIEDVAAALPEYFYEWVEAGEPLEGGEADLGQAPDEAVYAQEMDENTLADMKLAETGALYSDIVADLDRNSVQTEGDVTFFSCVMSDGTQARFEGKNISIVEDGIVMPPGSSVTSLDALGKIYRYQGAVLADDAASASEQWLNVGYGYSFSSEKTSAERAQEVYTYEIGGVDANLWSEGYSCSTAYYAPNFVYFNAQDSNTASITLTSLRIGYDPSQKTTALTDAKLVASWYGEYAEGEAYRADKEDRADAEEGMYDFYLLLKQEALEEAGIEDQNRWLHFLPHDFYEAGDLKDANGNVLDKRTARVHAGDRLEITIGDSALEVELPMAEVYSGAQTLHQARPYSTLEALGAQRALVIPVVWADQTQLATEDVYALYQRALGRLIDERGNAVGDFSGVEDEVFSLSEYFSTASYGQLEISSFMTDWYFADQNFADDYEYIFPEVEFAQEVLDWVKASYPDMDWTQFDRDGDGYVDSIVLLSVGLSQNEGCMPSSFGGAVHSTGSNFSALAGAADDPRANCFLTVNHTFLREGKTNTLIHEFSHSFGLNDYYDASGYGVNAVGGYDMQGGSVGDWNAYSKLAVGWMRPRVVTSLVSGESVDVTIASSALTGDVILLPAASAEYDGPFGEYVMIDLLTDDGANAYDAAAYSLTDAAGVRISHVNAALKRVGEDYGRFGKAEDHGEYIGMEMYSNNYEENGFGIYNIEVIQAGGENTFTDPQKLYPYLRAQDLFYEGDRFAAEDYDQFFYQGLMDNGMPLGYTVEIMRIGTDEQGTPFATVRIMANGQ